jgi:hypothetical protein
LNHNRHIYGQNSGKNYNIKTASTSHESVVNFNQLGKTLTDQSCKYEGVKVADKVGGMPATGLTHLVPIHLPSGNNKINSTQNYNFDKNRLKVSEKKC